MPLYENAKYLIRANLEECARGGRVRAVVIGHFTQAQYETINTYRESVGLPKLESPEIVLIGSHLFRSRVTRDGYTIDEFARLDLSRMDFTEIYSEFVEAAKLPDEVQVAADIQQKITDYFARGGR